MKKIEAGCVDLVFADPPFNIGYEYDKYHDNRDSDDYLSWSRDWTAEVSRVLKPDGAFWLAIGDDYAAELKVMLQQEHGLHCRSWVVWYYTFGVNCKFKFSRSHTHLFHMVKDPDAFTFNIDAIRIPSARQLVYGDKRANPKGRLPDDTWVLRPQDLAEGFNGDEDTWYFPRVCGTFKERAGWHGCQMPEQLLGRIIRACSNEGELVLDPFAGSGTTLAVAKKLRRRYLGYEISEDYTQQVKERLKKAKAGSRLDGAPEPLVSVPDTASGRRLKDKTAPKEKIEPRTTAKKVAKKADQKTAKKEPKPEAPKEAKAEKKATTKKAAPKEATEKKTVKKKATAKKKAATKKKAAAKKSVKKTAEKKSPAKKAEKKTPKKKAAEDKKVVAKKKKTTKKKPVKKKAAKKKAEKKVDPEQRLLPGF